MVFKITKPPSHVDRTQDKVSSRFESIGALAIFDKNVIEAKAFGIECASNQSGDALTLNRDRGNFVAFGVFGQDHVEGDHAFCLGFQRTSQVQSVTRTQSGC